MESHVLDTVESTEAHAADCDESLAITSWVEISPDAVGRVIDTPPPGVGAGVTAVRGRRRIPPVSGHALEKLGHAIEYLTDEYIHEGCVGGFSGPRVEAIQLLMSLNREIYYECAIVPPLSERIREFVRRVIGA